MIIKYITDFFLITFLCLLVKTTYSQEKQHENFHLSVLSERMNLQEIPAFQNLTRQQHFQFVSILKEYSQDSLFEIRWQGVQWVNRLMGSVKDQLLAGEFISLGLIHALDADNRITYMAIQGLRAVSHFNFTSTQKDTVLQLMQTLENRTILTDIYLISGMQQIEGAVPVLKDVASNNQNPFMQRWVALATLARMGDTEAEYSLLSYLERMPVNLRVIDGLYSYIVYSQSRLNINYLIEYILYDLSGCESSNPEYSQSIPCGYMVLRVLAPGIRELKWEEELQDLPHQQSLEKAQAKLKQLENNWSFENNYKM
jgi:hypothetical protein